MYTYKIIFLSRFARIRTKNYETLLPKKCGYNIPSYTVNISIKRIPFFIVGGSPM